MQKQEKRRDMRLKRFWRSPKATSSDDSGGGCESPICTTSRLPSIHSPLINKPACSLPLLQVWPSQDSPRGEADGQSFVFPTICDTDINDHIENDRRRNSLYCDTLLHHTAGVDSGIDSIQASPSPNNMLMCPLGIVSTAAAATAATIPLTTVTTIATDETNNNNNNNKNASPCSSPKNGSPTPSMRNNSFSFNYNNKGRRMSSALLHPDHARLLALRRQQSSPDQISVDEIVEFNNGTGGGGGGYLAGGGNSTNGHNHTTSSSTTSSMTSIACSSVKNQRSSDPWLHPDRDLNQHQQEYGRRRSSTMTTRYSLFDALDLEYALLRAAARGSVGPYSLSESLHKLTFTQSLAFPALARGLATKSRRRSGPQHSSTRPLNPHESGLNTFAKIITAVVLVVVSFLVFLVVYKFVRT